MAKTHHHEKILAGLFHHRWAVPVIAELHRGNGAKFITLVKRLAVGRDTLSRTLRALDERGWAQRNPGDGHPMRPEYILTEAGKQIGPPCVELMDALTAAGHLSIGLKKWSMPVIQAVGREQRRFYELADSLPTCTPRALTQSLKELDEAGLVWRELVDEYPPRTVYRLTAAGEILLPPLEAMGLCPTPIS